MHHIDVVTRNFEIQSASILRKTATRPESFGHDERLWTRTCIARKNFRRAGQIRVEGQVKATTARPARRAADSSPQPLYDLDVRIVAFSRSPGE